jgi:hypothetical protein
MGYRSEVRSCVYSDDGALFDAFIAGQKLTNPRIFDEWFKDEIKFIDKSYTFDPPREDGVTTITTKILDLKGDGWKWYDSYEDVGAWIKLLQDAEAQGLNYEFIRVGEEEGDIERETGGENVENYLDTWTEIACGYDD